MRQMIFIGVRCQITWRPSLFSIGSLNELKILIVPLVHLQSYNQLKACWRVAEKLSNFCGDLQYDLPVHKNIELYLVTQSRNKKGKTQYIHRVPYSKCQVQQNGKMSAFFILLCKPNVCYLPTRGFCHFGSHLTSEFSKLFQIKNELLTA